MLQETTLNLVKISQFWELWNQDSNSGLPASKPTDFQSHFVICKVLVKLKSLSWWRNSLHRILSQQAFYCQLALRLCLCIKLAVVTVAGEPGTVLWVWSPYCPGGWAGRFFRAWVCLGEELWQKKEVNRRAFRKRANNKRKKKVESTNEQTNLQMKKWIFIHWWCEIR